MQIRYNHDGRIYLIEAPSGSKLVRGDRLPFSFRCPPGDSLLIPWEGQMITIPDDPPELLPLLADAGRLGLRLVRVEEVVGTLSEDDGVSPPRQ